MIAWRTGTMNQTLINVVGYALLVLIKHRNVNGLLFFSQNLAKEVTPVEYKTLFETFFQTYQKELTVDDVNFFNKAGNDIIKKNKPKINKKKRVKVDEEKHMRNIKKTIIFLQKKMGWELGLDYSFLDGNIHMSSENKKKLREIMNN